MQKKLTDGGLLTQLQQGAAIYDKNVIDLMKNKVILDVYEYQKMIRESEKYSLQYKNLTSIVEQQLREQYDYEIRSLKNTIEQLKSDKNKYEDKYYQLRDKISKYKRTNWLKRNINMLDI